MDDHRPFASQVPRQHQRIATACVTPWRCPAPTFPPRSAKFCPSQTRYRGETGFVAGRAELRNILVRSNTWHQPNGPETPNSKPAPKYLRWPRDKLGAGGPFGATQPTRYQAPTPSRRRISLLCGNLRTQEGC